MICHFSSFATYRDESIPVNPFWLLSIGRERGLYWKGFAFAI